MKKLFLIAILFLPLALCAQNHYLGIKAGANFSNISFSSEGSLLDFKTRTGVIAGLTYDYYFQKLLSVGAELSYEQRGNTAEILFTDEIGNVIGEGTLTYIYDYIKLPLKAGVVLGNKLNFFANIGIVPAVNVVSKMKFPRDVQGESEKDIKEDVNNFDLSGMLDIGACLKFAGRFQAFVSAGYQHSFTNFNGKDYFQDMDMKHYAFSATAGIKYALKK